MPIIQVHLLEGRSVEQKRRMVAAVTEAIVGSLGVNPEQVRILINELLPEHYGLAGVTLGEQPLSTRASHGGSDVPPRSVAGGFGIRG